MLDLEKYQSIGEALKDALTQFADETCLIEADRDREKTRLTYSDFKELAMKKRDYAAGSQKMAGNEQIAAEVGKNPAGIGYVGMAYTKAGGVKVVLIDGATPSIQSVQNNSYPYWRPTFYYTNGEPSGIAKSFLDFTLSSVGQKIVNQVGFVPIK